jgi:hypothetical protein
LRDLGHDLPPAVERRQLPRRQRPPGALTFDPELAGRLLLVPWADAVAARPAWIAGDGVHGTPEGYRGRAQMYADAARSCGS